MQTRSLLVVVTLLEGLTGVGLVLVPALVAQLLLGQSLSAGAPELFARVAGMALIALAFNCWLERHAVAPRSLLSGLFVYSAGATIVLLHGWLAHGLQGVLWWPTVLFHAGVVAWVGFTLWGRAGRAP